MDKKPLLCARDISYHVGNKTILDNINFEIEEKGLKTVIGPNGGGKTTLLKILMGILKPSKGKIIKEKTLKIGYTPQNFSVNPFLPIKVSEFLKLHKSKNQIQQKQICELLQIQDLQNSMLYSISGGELQKVLLARAILRNPDILFLDEPTHHLDIKGQNKFYEYIHILQEQIGIAVLLVSHDLHFVMSLSSEVLCINKKICCKGLPQEINNNPFFSQVLNWQENNIAVYQHKEHSNSV